MRRLMPLIAIALLLAACAQPGESNPAAPAIITPATSSVAMGSTPPPAATKLVVMTHDSFSISQEVLDAFQQETGITVELLKAGDTGAALNQAILSKNAPLADVLYGVDNTFLSRALEAEIFVPYASPQLADLPSELQLDPSNQLLPVDYGYVTINYDKAALEAAGLEPPSDLRDLTKPEWKSKLIVQNPATSSPGLAFLLATIAHFGESGDYTWREYWRDLRANDVYISPDWTDAYSTQFSGSSGQGPRPLVVSYATSPAAELFFSEGALSEPPTGNLLVPGGSFKQIEFVGILKGTANQAAAQRFVDFLLQPQFQSDVPLQMFVYPANPAATLPELFTKFAETPSDDNALSPVQIEQGREGWLEEWTELVLR